MQTESHTKFEFIRKLMEGRTEEEICDAEENYKKYILVVWRIVCRLEREEQEAKMMKVYEDISPNSEVESH